MQLAIRCGIQRIIIITKNKKQRLLAPTGALHRSPIHGALEIYGFF